MEHPVDVRGEILCAVRVHVHLKAGGTDQVDSAIFNAAGIDFENKYDAYLFKAQYAVCHDRKIFVYMGELNTDSRRPGNRRDIEIFDFDTAPGCEISAGGASRFVMPDSIAVAGSELQADPACPCRPDKQRSEIAEVKGERGWSRAN